MSAIVIAVRPRAKIFLWRLAVLVASFLFVSLPVWAAAPPYYDKNQPARYLPLTAEAEDQIKTGSSRAGSLIFGNTFSAYRISVLPVGGGGKVGVNLDKIGDIDPNAVLDVNGQVRIRGGNPAADNVLTSDANGLATWQPPSVDPNDYLTTGPDNQTKDGSLELYNNLFAKKIGVNLNNPLDINDSVAVLDVNGQVRIGGGNPGNGRVLTAVNSFGLAEWRNPVLGEVGANQCPSPWGGIWQFPLGGVDCHDFVTETKNLPASGIVGSTIPSPFNPDLPEAWPVDEFSSGYLGFGVVTQPFADPVSGLTTNGGVSGDLLAVEMPASGSGLQLADTLLSFRDDCPTNSLWVFDETAGWTCVLGSSSTSLSGGATLYLKALSYPGFDPSPPKNQPLTCGNVTAGGGAGTWSEVHYAPYESVGTYSGTNYYNQVRTCRSTTANCQILYLRSSSTVMPSCPTGFVPPVDVIPPALPYSFKEYSFASPTNSINNVRPCLRCQ